MHDILRASFFQKSHKRSRVISRYDRRAIACSHMLPVETLSLFVWRPRPPEAATPSVPNESYAVTFLAKRGGILTSRARVYAELYNFIRRLGVSVELARVIAELANISGACRRLNAALLDVCKRRTRR